MNQEEARRVSKLEEVLRFYAEPHNYNDHRPNSFYVEMSPVVKDTGAKARAALSMVVTTPTPKGRGLLDS